MFILYAILANFCALVLEDCRNCHPFSLYVHFCFRHYFLTCFFFFFFPLIFGILLFLEWSILWYHIHFFKCHKNQQWQPTWISVVGASFWNILVDYFSYFIIIIFWKQKYYSKITKIILSEYSYYRRRWLGVGDIL